MLAVDLDQPISEYLATYRIPGLALALVRDGRPLYAAGYGLSSADAAVAVTPRTLFRIASITKPLTATVVLRLVEAGLLDLDRPVTEYLPWLSLSQPGAAQRLTLRMLLSHTAGLPVDYGPFGGGESAALEAYVRQVLPRYPLLAPPGRLYSYSNPGFNLAGLLVEAAAGEPFTAAMQRLVFDPLEMKSTTFSLSQAAKGPLALPHDLDPEGRPVARRAWDDCAASNPSGQAFSTVLDLQNFALLQIQRGRYGAEQVLSSESVALMQTPHVDLYTVDRRSYGLGLRLSTYKGVRLVGHTGLVSTFRGRLVVAPDHGAAVIILCNRNPEEAEAPLDRLIERLLDDLLDLPDAAAAAPPYQANRSVRRCYYGSFLSPYHGLAILREDQQDLSLRLNGVDIVLSAVSDRLYTGSRPGAAESLSLGLPRQAVDPCEFVLIDGAPYFRLAEDVVQDYDRERLQELCGDYHGVVEGDQETLHVWLEADRLVIGSRCYGWKAVCLPLGSDRFACERGLYEFVAGESGMLLRVWGYYLLRRLRGVAA